MISEQLNMNLISKLLYLIFLDEIIKPVSFWN